MKAVMISIHPKWYQFILQGEKTVEVRKTRPKIDTPFKCYIYETKGHGALQGSGQIIGEFVCDEIFDLQIGYWGQKGNDCLTYHERRQYLQDKSGYGWHISELIIYNKPLELTDFIHPTNGCVNEGKCFGCKFLDCGIDGILEDDCLADFDTDSYSILKRAPQSWCYVEESEVEKNEIQK